jgi:hypothetical protein
MAQAGFDTALCYDFFEEKQLMNIVNPIQI